MTSAIVVHNHFDRAWPWSADHFHHLWKVQGPVFFERMEHGDDRTLGMVLAESQSAAPATIERLACLSVQAGRTCIESLPALCEATFQGRGVPSAEDRAHLEEKGVILYNQTSEGFWAQSVAECALALTLCALRRIPQLHHEIINSISPWDYSPPSEVGTPGGRGAQYCDDPSFTHGTLAGKRVRVAGAGNIGSRYAHFASTLGADVTMYDPFATEQAFHRSGARREHYLERLVEDAEIFAPTIPLTDSTRGVITADHIDALPKGCLVVWITRAGVCDMEAVRRRVLADELSLAADVWDVEPLPLEDPLMGRHNVVHTPHIAGRTADANRAWSQALVDQFKPVR